MWHNTGVKQLVIISLDSFSQGGLGFYFLCPSYVCLWEQIHVYRSSWLYQYLMQN